MKKLFLSFLFLVLALSFTVTLHGYEEGPSNSGNWVYGKVTYQSGSKCSKCCGIVLDMSFGGMSKNGCTNSKSEYKIFVASRTVQAIYFKGSKVWSGSKNCTGGARIDLVIK